jgi:hypothetical protein
MVHRRSPFSALVYRSENPDRFSESTTSRFSIAASSGGTGIYGRMPEDHNKTAGIAGGYQKNQLMSQ